MSTGIFGVAPEWGIPDACTTCDETIYDDPDTGQIPDDCTTCGEPIVDMWLNPDGTPQ